MKKSTLDFWLIIAIIVSFSTAAGFIAGCEKTKAAPRPTAQMFGIASACTDTGGIYTPSVITNFNSVILSINQAHFTRVCDQVYVSGSFSGTSDIDTLHSSFIKISLPVPSDLSAPPLFNLMGQAIVVQFGAEQTLNGAVGIIPISGPQGAVISWRATKKTAYSIVYSFSYTIK